MNHLSPTTGEARVIYVKCAPMDKNEGVVVDSNEIRELVISQAHLPYSSDSITETTDLDGAGLTSVTRMNVIIAIEDRYQIQFPDEMLTKATFQDIRSISDAVRSLLTQCHTSLLFFAYALLPEFSSIL